MKNEAIQLVFLILDYFFKSIISLLKYNKFMPQLDKFTLFSQIIWFLILFFGLYFFLIKFVLIKLISILRVRRWTLDKLMQDILVLRESHDIYNLIYTNLKNDTVCRTSILFENSGKKVDIFINNSEIFFNSIHKTIDVLSEKTPIIDLYLKSDCLLVANTFGNHEDELIENLYLTINLYFNSYYSDEEMVMYSEFLDTLLKIFIKH
jgi:hypothetical protein